ncbi:MAG: hypothetical protein P4L74_00505 [Candidatus Doudnabacteria bacterium]|nr:hypothetical protein [Candidatus Doudnabacteria bacterium]
MDPQRIKKIEDLVIQSKILSRQERGEWLALLDIMNDKQLAELEDILMAGKRQESLAGSGQRGADSGQGIGGQITNNKFQISNGGQGQIPNEKLSAKGGSASGGKITKPEQIKEIASGKAQMINSQTLATTPDMLREKFAAAPMGIPKLNHIMNLPRMGRIERGTPEQTANSKQQTFVSRQQTADSGDKSGFAGRLKAVMAEKELPGAVAELELPGRSRPKLEPAIHLNYGALPPVPRPKVGDSNQQTAVNRQQSADSKQRTADSGQRIEGGGKMGEKVNGPVAAAGPEAGVAPKKPELANAEPGLPKIQAVVNEILSNTLKPGYADKTPPIKSDPTEASSLAQVLAKKTTAEAGLTSGLSKLPDNVFMVPTASLKIKTPEAVAVPGPLVQSETAVLTDEEPQTKKSSAPQAKLSSLEDLSKIDTQNLEGGWDLLAKQISNLIRKYDYHQVSMNLEKSPLYISYLQTGSSALQQQTSLERLNDPPQPGILDRARFEQTADLLRAIQSG